MRRLDLNLTAEGGMITLDQPCSILAARRQCWKEVSQLLSV
ncbi:MULTISPECIES: hypothetical protein [Dorea]|nr:MULTISPECIES: hypothetical protein [Dorea]